LLKPRQSVCSWTLIKARDLALAPRQAKSCRLFCVRVAQFQFVMRSFEIAGFIAMISVLHLHAEDGQRMGSRFSTSGLDLMNTL
jgi:hypothetical protein